MQRATAKSRDQPVAHDGPVGGMKPLGGHNERSAVACTNQIECAQREVDMRAGTQVRGKGACSGTIAEPGFIRRRESMVAHVRRVADEQRRAVAKRNRGGPVILRKNRHPLGDPKGMRIGRKDAPGQRVGFERNQLCVGECLCCGQYEAPGAGAGVHHALTCGV